VHDRYVSQTVLIAGGMWTLAAASLGAAWAVFAFVPDGWRLAAMLAVTGGALGTVAATVTVRTYIERVCALIRATAGLSSGTVRASRQSGNARRSTAPAAIVPGRFCVRRHLCSMPGLGRVSIGVQTVRSR